MRIIKTVANKSMFDLRDALKALSNCIDLTKATFTLYDYEYNNVNAQLKISDRLLEYLGDSDRKGIQLSYSEMIDFSEFIFQTIDGKIDFIIKEPWFKAEIEIIDASLWEITSDHIDVMKCVEIQLNGVI